MLRRQPINIPLSFSHAMLSLMTVTPIVVNVSRFCSTQPAACSTSDATSSSSSSSSFTIYQSKIPELDLLLPALTGGVKVNTAPTSRSQCLMCGQAIKAGDFRFGLYVQGSGDYKFTVWVHQHCFEHSVPLCYPREAYGSLSKYFGLGLVPRAAVDTVLRVVTGSPSFSVVGLLGQKLADEIESQRLRLMERVDFFGKLRTQQVIEMLQANYPNANAKTWDSSNRLSDRENVIELAADSAAFGCGPDCSTCKRGGIFVPSTHDATMSRCSWHFDEFTKCWAEYDSEELPRPRVFDIDTSLDNMKKNIKTTGKVVKLAALVAPVQSSSSSTTPFLCIQKRLEKALADVNLQFQQQQQKSSGTPSIVRNPSVPLGGTSFFILVPNSSSSSSPSSRNSKTKSAKNSADKSSDDVTADGIPYNGKVNLAVQECRDIITQLGGQIVSKTEAEARPTDVMLVHPSVEGKGILPASTTTSSVGGSASSLIPPGCIHTSTVVSLQWLRDCKKHQRRILALESAIKYGMNVHYVQNAPDMTDRIKGYEEAKLRLNSQSGVARGGVPSSLSSSSSSTLPSCSSHHQEISVVGTVVVDPESGLSHSHQVFCAHKSRSSSSSSSLSASSAKDTYYSATLVLSDLSGGKNSSYLLQLLEKHDLQGALPQSSSSSSSSTTPSSLPLIPSVDKLQLMGSTKYVVWKRWGRIGDAQGNGSTFQTFDDIISARRAFEKAFFDRTQQHWGEPQKFDKQPGKYNWIDRPLADEKIAAAAAATSSSTSGDKNNKNNNKNSITFNSHPVIVHPPTRNLIGRLFDEKTMVQSMMTMKIDVAKMPLVGLRTETLDNGQKVLKELVELVKKKELAEAAASPTSSSAQKKLLAPTRNSPARLSIKENKNDPLFREIVSASNRFNSFIPRTCERGEEHQLIIDTTQKIAEQAQLLSDLSDILLTRQLSALSAGGAGDPVLRKYLSLDCTFEPLDMDLDKVPANVTDPDEIAELSYKIDEVKNILRYSKNGQGHTHRKFKIQNIWRIARKEEATRFKPFESDSNRQLLWHGSRFTNFVRILKDGLLIAPPGAVQSGQMFNFGIYFANCQSKAGNYCQLGFSSSSSRSSSSSDSTGLMLLSEVALGKQTVRTQSDSSLKLKTDEKSCYARGNHSPDPSGVLVDPRYGYKIPCGKLEKDPALSTSLIYDELIVYDIAQVKLRYLLEVSSD